MIRIKINLTSGDVISLEISGHAGYAEFGKDIVCAAVSALAETAVLGLEKVAGVKPLLRKRQGYFLLKLPTDITSQQLESSNIILKTVILGFKDISKSYPTYVRTETIEEV